MHIVTVANKNEGYFNYLVESCKRNGGKLEVLGWGQEWKGFIMKIHLFQEYLNKLDDDDIVCFVDGYDVIILQPIDKIETLFRNSGKKILLSLETKADLVPFADIFLHLFFGKYKNNRINSGTIIGYVKYLKKIYNNICNEYNCNDTNLDDQIILTKMCNKYYYNDADVDVDINRDIFLVISRFDSYKQTNCQLINNELVFNNNIKPCILHGNSNYNLNSILKKLGYNIDKVKYRDNLSYLLKATIIKTIIVIIVIIIIIIILIIIFNKYDKLNFNKN
jgi:hypothetical protein